MGKFPFFITAPRIEGLNACSQYPKYQSVSIITISSRRDPTVSPLLSSVSGGTLQTPSVTVLFFYNPVLSSASDKKEQKPNQGREHKSRPGGQTQSRRSPVDAPRTPRPWGGCGLQNAQRSTDGMQENHVFHFYVTTVINPLGVGGL